MNHDTPGEAHAMGSCSTADGSILLKELLGHGLAAHNEGGAVLGTLYALLENHTSKLVREITPCSTT